MKVRT